MFFSLEIHSLSEILNEIIRTIVNDNPEDARTPARQKKQLTALSEVRTMCCCISRFSARLETLPLQVMVTSEQFPSTKHFRNISLVLHLHFAHYISCVGYVIN